MTAASPANLPEQAELRRAAERSATNALSGADAISVTDELGKPGHNCGVFGVYAPGSPVAHLTFLGLYALQHRGQESAGIATADDHSMTVVRNMGLVSSVFNDRTLAGLHGHVAVGHTRYSTTGSSAFDASQPIHRASGDTQFAIGHNGNLTNTVQLATEHDVMDGSLRSDTDLVAELIARRMTHITNQPSLAGLGTDLGLSDHSAAGTGLATNGPVDGETATEASGNNEQIENASAASLLVRALCDVLPQLVGGFTFTVLGRDCLIGVRDPHGFWPLCLGRLPNGWVLASETPALDIVGATFEREVEPGEMVVIDGNGVTSHRPFEAAAVRSTPNAPSAASTNSAPATASASNPTSPQPHGCVFEFVYFSRPDSVLAGRSIYDARQRMGEHLATTAPVEADFVMPVPESGIPAAQGFARASGLPYRDGLVKNRYIGRTFIAPTQRLRSMGVRTKLNPIRRNIEGRRLVVVDDSIVRGTTTREIVAMLRAVGAAEVHLRISSPPYRFPCHYGMDTGTADELLASRLTLDETRDFLGVDTLAYLSYEHLLDAVDGSDGGFCTACLTGDYPVWIPAMASRTSLGARADDYQGQLVSVEPLAGVG